MVNVQDIDSLCVLDEPEGGVDRPYACMFGDLFESEAWDVLQARKIVVSEV